MGILRKLLGGGKRDDEKARGVLSMFVDGGPLDSMTAAIPRLKETAIAGVKLVEATQLDVILEKVADFVDNHDAILPEFRFKRGRTEITIIPRRLPEGREKPASDGKEEAPEGKKAGPVD